MQIMLQKISDAAMFHRSPDASVRACEKQLRNVLDRRDLQPPTL
jgi:hypothetical protein